MILYKKRSYKKNKIVAAILSSILIFFTMSFNASAAEMNWTYDYTGEEQTFTAPYSGIYEFDLCGAQGSNSTFAGGKGGKTTIKIKLTRGDVVTVVVGGQDGYNGGGTGLVSNGGGATDIRINGERIAIAGGGGGGTTKKAGGAGGTTDSGNNSTSFAGTSDTTTKGSAGGGGGYKGGKSGYYYTKVESTICHGTMECTGSEFSWCEGPWENSPHAHTTYHYCCNVCGRREDKGNCDTGSCGHWSGGTYECAASTLGTVVHKASSYGGSNWYDTSVCNDGILQEGEREGNGICTISVISICQLYYQNTEVFNLYYNGTKVKNVYYDGILIYQE